MPDKLTAEQVEFLRLPYYAVVATIRDDGSPHQTAVWVDTDGEDVLFNTVEGRAKPRHLRRNPRVSIMVIDPDDGYRWVAVSGRAEFSHEGADAHIDFLARKYLGADVYPNHRPEDQRVIVRIRPEKVDSSGFDGPH